MDAMQRSKAQYIHLKIHSIDRRARNHMQSQQFLIMLSTPTPEWIKIFYWKILSKTRIFDNMVSGRHTADTHTCTGQKFHPIYTVFKLI